MLPRIGYLQIESPESNEGLQQGRSFLFDFEGGDFVMKDGRLVEASDEEALSIWIEKLLRTEKGKHEIYTSSYGVSLEDLIVGQNLPIEYIKSEIKREITEALMKNPQVMNISGWQLEKDNSCLTIFFNVNNAIEQEVMLSV